MSNSIATYWNIVYLVEGNLFDWAHSVWPVMVLVHAIQSKATLLKISQRRRCYERCGSRNKEVSMRLPTECMTAHAVALARSDVDAALEPVVFTWPITSRLSFWVNHLVCLRIYEWALIWFVCVCVCAAGDCLSGYVHCSHMINVQARLYVYSPLSHCCVN